VDEKSAENEIVGSVSTCLSIASRIAAFYPGAAAGFAVAGLFGDMSGIAKRFFDRKQQRCEARIEALNRELMENRLGDIEEQLEITEKQIDVAANVFQQMLQDDEDAKERYYGALLEMVFRNNTDTQSFKIILSAIGSLSRIELEEFEFVCIPHDQRYLFQLHRFTEQDAPVNRSYSYNSVFITRLLSVSFIEAYIYYPDEREVLEKGEMPETSYSVTSFGRDYLFALTGGG
jgi:hypothetical protein